MSIAKFLMSIVLCTATIHVSHAKTLRFLSGEIYAAELSTNKLIVGNADKPGSEFESSDAYSSYNNAKPLASLDENNKGYLVLFVKLDPKRRLSVYDYTVTGPNGEYNCAAIAKGDEIFQPYNPSDKSDHSWRVSGKQLFKMLFVVEHPKVKDKNTIASFTLKYNLTSPAKTLKFVALSKGANPFTSANNLKNGHYITKAPTSAKPTKSTVARAPQKKTPPSSQKVASIANKPTNKKAGKPFTMPKTDSELVKFFMGRWKAPKNKAIFKVAKNNKNKKNGWTIKNGKPYKIDKNNKQILIEILSQNKVKFNNREFIRIQN